MTTSTRTLRPVLIPATLLSAIASLLGLIWLIQPEASYFNEPKSAFLVSLFGPLTATIICTATGALGLIVGIIALVKENATFVNPSAPPNPAPKPTWTTAILVTSAVQVLVFGIGFGSFATLSTSGYLVAMATPVILLVVLVQVVRKYPLARWTVGVPLLGLAVVGVILGREALATLGSNLGAAFAEQSVPLLMTLMFIGIGATWAASAMLTLRASDTGREVTTWVTRHRRMFTIIAACGPLPYAVARLSWLTPWPVFGGEAGLDLPTRIQGLLLSSGAWLAVILTIGLLMPWGEIFPRWMPVLAGRRVPVAAAAIPGGIVAAMLCFAAVPMLQFSAATGPAGIVTMGLVFPCFIWGPALALAVWGYVGHRENLDRRGGSDLRRGGSDVGVPARTQPAR